MGTNNKQIDKWETPAKLERIRAWIAEGLEDKQIAYEMGIHPVTLSNWRRKSPKIRAAMFRPAKDGSGKDIRDIGRNGRRMVWHIEELERTITEWKEERKRDKLPLTITSLVCKLGISRDTFDRYVNSENTEIQGTLTTDIDGRSHEKRIAEILKNCYRECESSLVDRCLGRGQCAGAIFILKNHYHYTDVQKIETSRGPVVVHWGSDVPKELIPEGGIIEKDS